VWMRVPWDQAKALRQPLADDALRIARAGRRVGRSSSRLNL
jgi:hypothetical protein